jgi:hypothetical protein
MPLILVLAILAHAGNLPQAAKKVQEPLKAWSWMRITNRLRTHLFTPTI